MDRYHSRCTKFQNLYIKPRKNNFKIIHLIINLNKQTQTRKQFTKNFETDQELFNLWWVKDAIFFNSFFQFLRVIITKKYKCTYQFLWWLVQKGVTYVFVLITILLKYYTMHDVQSDYKSYISHYKNVFWRQNMAGHYHRQSFQKQNITVVGVVNK